MSGGLWIASYEGGSFTSNCITHQSIIHVLGIRKDFDQIGIILTSWNTTTQGNTKVCFLLCLWLIVVFPPLWGNTEMEK